MPRPRSPQEDEQKEAAPILPALAIDPNGIYRASQIQAALGLGSRALRAEWRAGRLRIVRRCNRNFLLGRDVLEWLNSGVLPAPGRRAETNGAAK
jgi:hypothetical protein